MYEKEIRVLDGCWNRRTQPINRAINAAIALMRATEPKDEAAEREHCRSATRADAPLSSPDWFVRRTELELERAAVRAECAAGASAGVPPAWWRGRELELLAEIERLKRRLGVV
jgi:hypothetical protein